MRGSGTWRVGSKLGSMTPIMATGLVGEEGGAGDWVGASVKVNAGVAVVGLGARVGAGDGVEISMTFGRGVPAMLWKPVVATLSIVAGPVVEGTVVVLAEDEVDLSVGDF